MQFQSGQSGNPGGKRKEKPYRDALVLAINQADGDKKLLRKVAEAHVAKALEGDMAAIREIADRIDGKVAQTSIVQGDEEGGPVRYERAERVIIDQPANTNSTAVPATLKARSV